MSDRIKCRRYGDTGREVVVLHGGPGAPGSVASLCRILGEFARVREPLQRRAGGEPLTVAVHVADLAAVAPPRATVVGHSWGAMLALSFATVHPERVEQLVLIGCGTYDTAGRAAYVANRAGREDSVAKGALKAALERTNDSVERDRILGELGRLASDTGSVDMVPDAESELPADARGHAETWADVLARQRQGREPQSFAAIRCPVTMLHGADDPHPGPQIAGVLRRFMPQLEYVEFARCGHEPWRERAAANAVLGTLRLLLG